MPGSSAGMQNPMMPYALRPPFLSEVQKTVFVSGPKHRGDRKAERNRNATVSHMAEINMASTNESGFGRNGTCNCAQTTAEALFV